MGKALTVRAIDTLKPGSSRREIPDGLIGGLYLVVQPSGAKSWACRYRANGTPRKLTIGAYPGIDLKSARELAQRALVDVASGGDPAGVKQSAKTKAIPPSDRDLVEKVAASFVERYVKANTRASSAKETERILNREITPKWKGRRLGSITRAEIHELLDGIVDRGSPIQANRVLAATRKMCAWAVERGLIEASPCDKIKAPSAERSRDRVLSDAELRAVWDACGAIGWPFGPLVKMLALTGQRREEVGSMRWSEVDLDAKLWTLPRERSKNDQAHTVPLSDPALQMLKALPHVGEFVFSTNARNPVAGYSKAKIRIDALIAETAEGNAALPAWVFHDLRRTAATGMARLGIALPVVEKVLNHTSGSFGGIVGVYQRHGFSDEKRTALEAWGRFVEQLVSGTPAGNVVEMRFAS
ncbi:tyrosine-type recombinase/integrase [Lichenihabitans psoromatis]|uniref:tyrosine-type recombinase/integrase n=1 Tax=Lichenihabitans psoromatis TaxID=2528642 RepID=UPI00103624A3|nr:site-specific integrase [Lichenihabitans psoromatis]